MTDEQFLKECPVSPAASQEPVLEALALLHTAYPDERVEIWTRQEPGEPVLYGANVGPEASEYSPWLPSPIRAAEKLIASAGERQSQKQRIMAKIDLLQEQLRNLQTKAA